MMLLSAVFAAVVLLNTCQCQQDVGLESDLRKLIQQELEGMEGRLMQHIDASIEKVECGKEGMGLCSSHAKGEWGPAYKDGDTYLAFRGTARVGHSILDSYTGKTKLNIEPCCTQMNGSLPCSGHYRNDAILDNWQGIEEVIVELYEQGVVKQTMKFNAYGTDYMSWFSQDKLTDDGIWNDLLGFQQVNKPGYYFNIQGDALGTNNRHFEINYQYGGCDNDRGWMGIVDGVTTACHWENYVTFPEILYSRETTHANFEDGSSIEHADVMAIFVKPSTKCKANSVY